MTNPTSEQLNKRISKENGKWPAPEQRLSDGGGEVRLFWDNTRYETVNLMECYRAFRDAIKKCRDIAFWMTDPTALVPFSYVCEQLNKDPDKLAAAFFSGVDDNLLRIICNRPKFRCPICNQKRTG